MDTPLIEPSVMEFTVVSVDSGSSYLKMYDGQNRVSQPAVVKQISKDAPPMRDEIEVDGLRYVVGHGALIALRGGSDDPYVERGYHGGVAQYVQLCHGLHQLKAGGDFDVIMHSLPYLESSDAKYNQRVKDRREFRWKIGGIEHEVRFDSSAVMPQGTGALNLWASRFTGTEKPRLVSFVDIGSCTTDFVTAEFDERTGDYQYCTDKSTSLRAVGAQDPVINLRRLRDRWHELFRNMDGMQQVQFGYHELMDMPRKNAFTSRCGTEIVDLRPFFVSACDVFTADIMRAIRHVLESLWYKVDQIVLTGGGAEFFDLHQAGDSRVEVMDLWSNVEGQYLAATSGAATHAPEEKSPKPPLRTKVKVKWEEPKRELQPKSSPSEN